MTITEDGSMKRTRSSTFVIESINDEPVKSHSEEKQPGKLVGLLLRNKYTGIQIYNILQAETGSPISVCFSSLSSQK